MDSPAGLASRIAVSVVTARMQRRLAPAPSPSDFNGGCGMSRDVKMATTLGFNKDYGHLCR